MMVFKFGGTLVFERSSAYPAATLKRIDQEKITGLPGVPTLFAVLLQMDLSRFDLSSLRYLTNTAAALPVEHTRRLQEAFSWTRLYSMYGLTECKRTLYLPPEELNRRPGSVGIPIPGTEVWIEDESGKRLGSGEVGELVLRGSHVMQSYWNNPEVTASVISCASTGGSTPDTCMCAICYSSFCLETLLCQGFRLLWHPLTRLEASTEPI
jgi:long-chain acyl-CoA synthetase